LSYSGACPSIRDASLAAISIGIGRSPTTGGIARRYGYLNTATSEVS
jgi:hypothetical protein